MSVYRRGRIWHYDFLFAGQRFKESAKTTSRTVAKEAERRRRREVEEGYNGIVKEDRPWRVKTFSRAAEEYMTSYRKRNERSVTYLTYCLKHLLPRFGNRLLVEIDVNSVRTYQDARIDEKAHPKTINEEVGVLLRIMRELGKVIRARMAGENTLRLKYEEFEGIALNDEQTERLYDATNPDPAEPQNKEKYWGCRKTRSRMIKPAISIALNTTMRDSEIRHLTWGQIDSMNGIVTAGKSKTPAGTGRAIPINSDLRAVLDEYRTWYEKNVGPTASPCFLFPAHVRKGGTWNPFKPISSMKTAWKNVRAKAGLEVRFHDLRHTAVTDLLENSGESEETVMAIAGHVSRKMKERYAHIRIEAKRRAVEAIAARRGKHVS